jgi:hypothetical protein
LDGIRAVGKTSILNFVEGDPPSGVLPVSVRLDRPMPKSNGDLFYILGTQIADATGCTSDLPEAADFEDSPGRAFNALLKQVVAKGNHVLLLVDELQVLFQLAKRQMSSQGNAKGPDVEALNLLRAYLDEGDLSAIFTGSLMRRELRELLPNHPNFWRNVVTKKAGFISSLDVAAVLTLAPEGKGVPIRFGTDVLMRVYDHTAGHPWLTQNMAAELMDTLNSQERVVVCREDVDHAAAHLVEMDHHFDGFWWVRSRLDEKLDGPIFTFILDNQSSAGSGVSLETLLKSVASASGLSEDSVRARKDRLKDIELLADDGAGIVRIKGLLLEEWLKSKRSGEGSLPTERSTGGTSDIRSVVAVIADGENIAVALRHEAPQRIVRTLWKRIDALGEMERAFAQVSADWGNSAFAGWADEYRRMGFEPVRPLRPGKREEADHDLRDRANELLNRHSWLDTYVVIAGDHSLFGTCEQILMKGKTVLLLYARGTRASEYKQLAVRFGDRFSMEEIGSLGFELA